MALIDVKVPQLSESVAEATLLQWKKQPGQAVAADEILIEIETDKVVLEIPAPVAGVLSQTLVAGGASVTSGQPIAQIDTEAAVGTSTMPTTTATPDGAAPAPPPVQAAAASAIAMPAAAKLMSDQGLAASAVAGTGKDGRITKGDVLAAVGQPVEQEGIDPLRHQLYAQLHEQLGRDKY